MDFKVIIRLNNMLDDTDACVVHYVFKQQIMEFLDFDQHPQDLQIHIQEVER